jgi:hypothetical protein
MTDVRAITVKNPWAWAIAHAGKNIENRSRPVSYRGLLLIHAGATWSDRGASDERIAAAWGPWHSDGRIPGPCHPCPNPDYFRPGVVAIAQLVDVHLQTLDCLTDPDRCDPWGEQSYLHHNADGTTRMVFDVHHFVLEEIRALPELVPARGRLGLWRPDADVLDAVLVQVEVPW